MTYGSQLRALYGRIFPCVLGPSVLGCTATEGTPTFSDAYPDVPRPGPSAAVEPPGTGTLWDRLGRESWRNFYRRTDPLGWRVFSDDESPHDVLTPEVPRAAAGDPGPKVATHSGYQHSVEYRRVVGDFTRILADQTAQLVVGDQLDELSDVGPLISERAASDVIERVEEAVRAGATLVSGGTREGAFVAPTILVDVPVDQAVFREETFGPVVPIVAFDSLDEAVGLANDSRYGLQAAVFTRDLGTALSVAYGLEAGGVIVNWSSAVRTENLPFGGLKMSGHGRESVHDTMLAMTEQKVILLYDVLAIAVTGVTPA